MQTSHKSLDRKSLLAIAQSVGKDYQNATPQVITDALRDEFRVVAAKRQSLIRSLLNGTNVGEFAPKADDHQSIQQIIVISDGRSNVGPSVQALEEFLSRVSNGKNTPKVVGTDLKALDPEILLLRLRIIQLERRITELESKSKAK